MKHAFLIHWHPDEAEVLARPLREAGWTVTIEAEDGARAAAAVKSRQPDLVIVSLARLPSHGRITAEHLAGQKATRGIPVVFLNGTDAAIEKVRSRLPDARFVSGTDLVAVVETA